MWYCAFISCDRPLVLYKKRMILMDKGGVPHVSIIQAFPLVTEYKNKHSSSGKCVNDMHWAWESLCSIKVSKNTLSMYSNVEKIPIVYDLSVVHHLFRVQHLLFARRRTNSNLTPLSVMAWVDAWPRLTSPERVDSRSLRNVEQKQSQHVKVTARSGRHETIPMHISDQWCICIL